MYYYPANVEEASTDAGVLTESSIMTPFGSRGLESCDWLTGTGFLFGGDENVLELHAGDGVHLVKIPRPMEAYTLQP